MVTETAIPQHLRCPRTQPSRMPAGFEAPYPTWVSRFAEDAPPLVIAYFGAQHARALPQDAHSKVRSMLATDPKPPHWLEARCRDGADYDTSVLIAYWRDGAEFEAWRQASGFDRWWADAARDAEPLGRFLEVVIPPMERLEVAYAPPDLPQGAGNLQRGASACPVAEHAYWGSARDRIPASQTDSLQNVRETLSLRRSGARVTVLPGENVCMIRSGQDWSDTAGNERTLYLDRVQPKLVDGMTYLRDQGRDIGCFTCRYMQVMGESGAATENTFGQAYFKSLAALEHWAEHHPTHLAIFGTFLREMAPLGDAMRLRLWHEVMVLPASAQRFEYINCHDRTGLMGGAEG